jgi:alpha-L-fucosidase
MKRRALLKQLGLGFSALSLAKPTFAQNSFANFSGGEKIATGRFTPDWASLEQYQVPKWFQDAKFGMWAHWGPMSGGGRRLVCQRDVSRGRLAI